MKTKIHLYLFLIIFAVSCTDLESKQSWLFTDDDFPANERDAETLVAAAAYGAFNAYWGSGFSAGENGWHVISDMCTDVLYCNWGDDRFLPLNAVNFTPNANACTRFYREKIAQLGVATLTYEKIAHVPMPNCIADRGGWLICCSTFMADCRFPTSKR